MLLSITSARGSKRGPPNMEPARRTRKWFTRRGLAAEARALDVVVCGGAWHGGRGHLRRRCRCGDEETPFHRYWSCPRLGEMVDDDGASITESTQWLRQEFEGRVGEYSCLWGRGILPRSLVDPGPQLAPDEVVIDVAGDFSGTFGDSAVAYSDGSGGPKHAPSSAPVAGSGLATAHWHIDGDKLTVRSVALAASAVPGGQTVPRAELWATCVAAGEASRGGGGELRADAAYVVDTWNSEQRLQKARSTANGGLWARLARTTADRDVHLRITKVKAHVKPADIIRNGGSVVDYIGNHLADAAAGTVAEKMLSGSNRAAAIARWESRAFEIARRLARIEAWHWRQPTETVYLPPEPLAPWEPPDPRQLQSRLQAQVEEQGHVLRRMKGLMVCSRCLKKRQAHNHRFWTTTLCRPKWAVRRTQREPEARERCNTRRMEERRDIEDIGVELAEHDNTEHVDGEHDRELQEDCVDMSNGLGNSGYGDDQQGGDVDGEGQDEGAYGDDQVYVAGGTYAGNLPEPPSSSAEGAASHRLQEEAGRGACHGHGHNAAEQTEPKRRRIGDGAADGDEDPFGYDGLGFDDAEARGDDTGEAEPASSPPPSAPPQPAAAEVAAAAFGAQLEDTPPTQPPHASAEEEELTRKTRRKMVLEKLAEVRKRRRVEAGATLAAWSIVSAAIDVRELDSVLVHEGPPPFEVHPGHALLACGGYYGCIRCGHVVGWQRHAQLGAPCRGNCPRGSVRAIRRLSKGLHPSARGDEGDTSQWPSGERSPRPLRLRAAPVKLCASVRHCFPFFFSSFSCLDA